MNFSKEFYNFLKILNTCKLLGFWYLEFNDKYKDSHALHYLALCIISFEIDCMCILEVIKKVSHLNNLIVPKFFVF